MIFYFKMMLQKNYKANIDTKILIKYKERGKNTKWYPASTK